MKHYNVQVHIQEVRIDEQTDKRKVRDLLNISTQVPSKQEATATVLRFLSVAKPEHVHRASCFGAIGELQCDGKD